MIRAIETRDLRVIAGDNLPRVQDIRLAERLGYERPRKIRDLIERNIAELENYASLPRHGANPGSQGGRPSTEYWLTRPQARLICMWSNTALAVDARAELNAVFDAWERGELKPASEVPTITGMADLFAGLKPQIERIDGNVLHLKSNVDRIEKRIDDLIPRRDFPSDYQKQYRLTVHKACNGKCPCGCGNQILDESGELLPCAHFDHWYAPNRVGVFDGWLVFSECNQAMRDTKFREKKYPRFAVFHEERRKLFPNDRAKEPAVKKGSRTTCTETQFTMHDRW